MNDRATALREAFAAFLGKEQFRKFAKQGFLKGQWKFWQETLWNEFIAANPAYASFQDELPAAIRICYLHGDELMRDKVPVVRGRTRLVTRMLEINLDKALHYFPN